MTTKGKRYLLILAVLLSACAKKSTPSTNSLSIASIPQACNFYAQGTHEWADKTLSHAVAYDCGMREGVHCWYFLGDPPSPAETSGRHETICE